MGIYCDRSNRNCIEDKRGFVMEEKKRGRPTEEKKDFLLQVRISEKTKKILDDICKEKKISRSDVVRIGIEKQKADC